MIAATAQGAWSWTRRLPDGSFVHQASQPSERAPNVCAVHGWAYDVVCTACEFGLHPWVTEQMLERSEPATSGGKRRRPRHRFHFSAKGAKHVASIR